MDDDPFGDIRVVDVTERDALENKPIELPRGRPVFVASAVEASAPRAAVPLNFQDGRAGRSDEYWQTSSSSAGGAQTAAAALAPAVLRPSAGAAGFAAAARPPSRPISSAAPMATSSALSPGTVKYSGPVAGGTRAVVSSSAAFSASSSSSSFSSSGGATVGGSSSGGSSGSAGGSGSSGGSATAGAGGRMIISTRQRGNPILAHIRHAWYDWSSEIKADFLPNRNTAVLYLSLRFHALNPRYLLRRLRDVKTRDFRLCALVVLTDVTDVERMLLDVQRTAILSEWTVFCASSVAEAARYMETFCVYEKKPATAIQERVEEGYLPRAVEVLTTIRSINRRDVITLLSRFQTLAGIMTASLAELQTCAGIAEKKARHLYDAFHKPLLPVGTGTSGSGFAATGTSAGSSSNRGTATAGAELEPDAVEFLTGADSSPSASASPRATPDGAAGVMAEASSGGLEESAGGSWGRAAGEGDSEVRNRLMLLTSVSVRRDQF